MTMPARLAAALLLAAVAAIFMSGLARAAEVAGACVHQPAPAGANGKRIALIVGNGGYGNDIPALRNPVHDAHAVAQAVTALGFETFLLTDATETALRQCLDHVYASLADADIAMFYYSGHGIQIRDENYLVATDAGIGDLPRAFVPVQPIVDRLQAQAKATLIFLDACRNNPLVKDGLPGLSVATGRGLVRVAGNTTLNASGEVQARGLMVGYSTSPNAVAVDGDGDLSPFTAAFVKAVGMSGHSIQRIMSDVTNDVGEQTDWGQTPWMKSSLTGELKLNGGETLAQAQAISDNRASRAAGLLNINGDRHAAIIEALKGLPASSNETVLEKFPKAYLALYSAVQTRQAVLPIKKMSVVALSVQGRAAVSPLVSGSRLGTPALWSTTERRLIAELPVAGRLWQFKFSPHGNLLATFSSKRITIWNGLDGTKRFDLGAGDRFSSADISPEENRLLIVRNRPTIMTMREGRLSIRPEPDARNSPASLTIVDIRTQRRVVLVKASELSGHLARGRTVSNLQARFGSNDTICFALAFEHSQDYAVGIFDLRLKKVVRLRVTHRISAIPLCDPAGKYMVRNYVGGPNDAGMEIWDLANDIVRDVAGPMVVSIDPNGNYVSSLGMSGEAQGFYDLSTGKKGHPATVPDGFVAYRNRMLRSDTGTLIGQDSSPSIWLDWPDETLSGPAVVQRALSELTPPERDEVVRERIDYIASGGP
ncbi:caspase family protein [Labrys neptuniae]